METKQIKDFYNKSLSQSSTTYEHCRWRKNSQAKASYVLSRRAVKKYALPLITEGDRVFELGPGPGTWTKFILQKNPSQVDMVDISSEMLLQAKENLLDKTELIDFIESDILDFKSSNTYDFFFSSRMIEYVPEKEQALSNIVSSLKPGAFGYLVTKTPQYNRPFKKHTHSSIHQNQIAPDSLETLLVGRNCAVIKKVHVTGIFPLVHCGLLDRFLTRVIQALPFRLGSIFSESYAIIFQKNNH